MKTINSLTFSLFLLVGLSIAIAAQNVNGTLSGVINDATGAPIANATVKLTQDERQFVREVMTDSNGQYRLTALLPGIYSIEITQAGFAALKREKSLRVLGGDSLYQTFTLQAGAVNETVNIIGTTDELSRAQVSASRGGAFGEKENTDLPMIAAGQGRNYRTQVYLLPGITPSALRAAHAPFAINGLRPVNTVNVMVDGADFNDPIGGILNGTGLSEQPVSQEVLSTTEVQTNNYKAEYGRAAGGTINLVTQPGANAWHGKMYNFHRNAAFDAKNPIFNRKGLFLRNHFGVVLNGAIIKDKLFFNLNAEGVGDRSVNLRNAVFTFTEAERATAVPAVRALLNHYPLPNIVTTSLAQPNFDPTVQRARQGGHFYFGRMDYVINQNHLVNFRYTKTASQPVALFPFFAQGASFNTNNGSYSAAWNSTLAPNLTNEARVYYTWRTSDSRPDAIGLGDPALNSKVGFITVAGAERIGSFFRDYTKLHNYQASNDTSWSADSHGIKFGGVVRFIQANTTANTNFDGVMVFASRTDFLRGTPAVYTRAFGDPRLDQRTEEFALYAQDDWRVRQNLQINFGARWELYGTPGDQFNRVPVNYQTDGNNIAPRFGFAWTPGRQKDFVVRGGYGIFYTPLPMNYIAQLRFTPPRVQTFTYFRPSLANLTGGAGAPSSNRTITAPDIVQPYSQQFNLTLDYRLFGSDTVVSAAYVGTRARHLGMTRLPNGGAQWPATINGAANPRPLASQFGNGVVTLLETGASSNYDSFQFSFNGRLAKGLMMRGSYTWSKAMDDISTDAQNFISETNRRLDRAVSDFDIRHNFNAAFLYALPFDDKLPSGLLRNLFGGWQTATIISLRSSLPFTLLSGTATPDGVAVNRINAVPNTVVRNATNFRAWSLAPGVTLNQIIPGFTGNFSAITPVGTLGRNSERADGYADVSFGLHKDFALTERVRMQFRSEVFNLFNTVNFLGYSTTLASPAFGTAQSVYGQRTMQLALRFSF
jgi:hypothetical protein